jgi:hypothetical protein
VHLAANIIVKELCQDEAYFYPETDNATEKILLHDYDRIFSVPGLYEQVVCDRLKCQSPTTVVEVLRDSISQSSDHPNSLRVLDLGAGNGMVGEALKKLGVSRLVGADIITEAREATEFAVGQDEGGRSPWSREGPTSFTLTRASRQ